MVSNTSVHANAREVLNPTEKVLIGFGRSVRSEDHLEAFKEGHPSKHPPPPRAEVAFAPT